MNQPNVNFAPVDYDPFADAPSRIVPTTEPQREIWLADQLGREASLAYNESVTLTIGGKLDVQALQKALLALTDRHEALRATISADGLSMIIAAQGSLAAEIVDLESLSATAAQAALDDLRAEAVETPFDLEHGPLMRATLLKLGAESHQLIITGHHIVCDGWSFGVIATELMALYAEMTGAGASELTSADSFGDYALAQLSAEHLAAGEADAQYWASIYENSVPMLELPVDRSRPLQRTFASRREDLRIPASTVEMVRKAGAKQGASLFSTMFAMFAGLITRMSGQDDVVVGVPAAGQAAAGKNALVGHCVNLLPIRVAVNVDQVAADLIKQTNSAVLDAYEHQSATFGSVLKKLQLARDPSRLPLVSVLFNVDAAISSADLSVAGLTVTLASNPRHAENFELFLNASQTDGEIVLELQYNTDLFDVSTVKRWLQLYRTALERLAADPQQTVAAVFAPTADDLALLARFNATAADYPRTARIDHLIAQQAAATPDAVAVVAGDISLSYRQIDQRANALAAELQQRGVEPGSLVGLSCGRNAHMIVALLGILKSGAGYVPLDPSFPAERLAFMAEDADLRIVVSDGTVSGEWNFGSAQRLDVDTLAERDTPVTGGSALDVAYVIYTSGSTGKPKGVRVPHHTVTNLLASVSREPGMDASHRVLAVTTLSFDIAVSEVILPLTVGACIVVADRTQATDGERLRELIETQGVNFIDATPSTWRLLLAAGWPGSPAVRAICTGEPLPPDLGRDLLGRVGELWNGYGPTETTVWSSFHRVTTISGTVPIGRPVANTRIDVVDEQRRPLPVGAIGELFIAGDGVTLGYLARPELTAERFLPDPYGEPGAYWYKTGDLGRWRSDGVLECLGRSDHQVKVRGYRIELGEIEANLANHPQVDRCVVITREDRPGDVRIVAYVVPKEPLDANALRDFLRRSLPEYMIPQHIVDLPAIPLLPNGKINRKALPKPEVGDLADRGERVAPRSDLERELLSVMEQVLYLPGLGIHDDFFAMGGHSLLAAQLTARLNKELDLNLPLRTLFEAPTVEKLAQAIEKVRLAGGGAKVIPHQPEQHRIPASLMQERLWYLEKMYPGRVVYHAPSAHRLFGLINEAAFERAFNEMVKRQAALRTRFEREGQMVYQCVEDDVRVTLFPAEDLSRLPAAERGAVLQSRLDALTAQTFELEKAPLFRVHVFRLAEDEHVLFFMPHHIVWDGWSFDLFYSELAGLYAAFCEGQPNPLPELSVTYGDFSVWHREWVKGPEYAAQVEYWRQRIRETGLPAPLPTDKPRSAKMSGEGATEWVSLDKRTTDALHDMSQAASTTLFVTLLSVYAVLLYEYARLSKLAIGTPVRARDALELEPIMGYFNNLLLLHLDVDPDERFDSFLNRVKSIVIQSFSYPDVPLEQLTRELPGSAAKTGTPLYQALFSFQDARQRIQRWGNLRHEAVMLFQRGATEDMGMWFLESEKGLYGGVTYNTDIFESSTAQRFTQRYVEIATHLVANPNARISDLVAANAVRAAVHPSQVLPSASEDAAVPYVAPASDLEVHLAGIWQRVLGIDRVGVHDNFFDLGGNSLQAVTVVLEMEKETGLAVDVDQIFANPTIAGVVQSGGIGKSATRVCSDTPVLLRRGTGEIPLFFIHDGFGEVFLYRHIVDRLHPELTVYGLKPQAINGRFAHTHIREMARAKVDMMRAIQPHGPYLVAGLCAGGVISFEVARQLQDAGERVAFVGIIDAADVAAVERPFRQGMERAKRVGEVFHKSDGESLTGYLSKVTTTLGKKTIGFTRHMIERHQERAKHSRVVDGLRSGAAVDAEIEFNKLYDFARIAHVPNGLFEGGDVVLFRATEDKGIEGDLPCRDQVVDPLFGWQQRVKAPIKAIDVPGGHSSALQEPDVDVLAAEMQRCIDEALARYR